LKKTTNANLKFILTEWVNGIAGLKKNKALIEIKRFEHRGGDVYDIVFHRESRNHGKVFKLNIIEEDKFYILSNIEFIGVITEYELLENPLFSKNDDNFLNYKSLQDRWLRTSDEIIFQNL
jgi:uncharacterized protein YkuJ